jgi:hypothetical protein
VRRRDERRRRKGDGTRVGKDRRGDENREDGSKEAGEEGSDEAMEKLGSEKETKEEGTGTARAAQLLRRRLEVGARLASQAHAAARGRVGLVECGVFLALSEPSLCRPPCPRDDCSQRCWAPPRV